MLSQEEEPTSIPAHTKDYDISGFSWQSYAQPQRKASVKEADGPLPEDSTPRQHPLVGLTDEEDLGCQA